ncbi:MAG: hypothetical protein JZU60_02545 [Ilumatobacteraceae bacterium]|nr:hypothetical protein [Ilumatobacteraceae bacterium]
MFERDLLSWVLKIPVILIWMDRENTVIKWRFTSVAEALLFVGSRQAAAEAVHSEA